jgi:energy-converting hydrogenase Eha subunit G
VTRLGRWYWASDRHGLTLIVGLAVFAWVATFFGAWLFGVRWLDAIIMANVAAVVMNLSISIYNLTVEP